MSPLTFDLFVDRSIKMKGRSQNAPVLSIGICFDNIRNKDTKNYFINRNQ